MIGWAYGDCEHCGGFFLLRAKDPWCFRCQRIRSGDLVEPSGWTTLAVAFAARRAQRGVERAVHELNREAEAMADVLCVDDLPWSTDEPKPDLQHLWDTSEAAHPYKRQKARPSHENYLRGFRHKGRG
jgi:hypothetical protein